MTQNKLTVKEAIEQGYQHFFYNSDGWQALKHLSDIEKGYKVDWSRDDIYIVEKEPKQVMSLSEGEIKDLIVDHLEGQYYDLTSNDDPNVVADAFGDFDFSDIEKKIDAVLEGITSYKSTDIKLIQ